jgi:hypothetical protein
LIVTLELEHVQELIPLFLDRCLEICSLHLAARSHDLLESTDKGYFESNEESGQAEFLLRYANRKDPVFALGHNRLNGIGDLGVMVLVSRHSVVPDSANLVFDECDATGFTSRMIRLTIVLWIVCMPLTPLILRDWYLERYCSCYTIISIAHLAVCFRHVRLTYNAGPKYHSIAHLAVCFRLVRLTFQRRIEVTFLCLRKFILLDRMLYSLLQSGAQAEMVSECEESLLQAGAQEEMVECEELSFVRKERYLL